MVSLRVALPHSFYISRLKGSVQWKLSWVENGAIRSVGASDCGAGHSFVVLFTFHLGFAIFPFPVSTVQFTGEFWINRWSGASDVAPIELALYSCHSYYYWRWVAFGAKRRSGGMECSLHLKAKQDEFVAPIRSFRGFFMFAALRLLAEHESQDQ